MLNMAEMNIEVGKKYMMTRNVRGVDEKAFPATVTYAEDRGDFLYIGYVPDDFRICRWGYCKIKKQGRYKAINWRFDSVPA